MTGAMRKMGVYLGLVEEDAPEEFETNGTAARARSYDRDEPASSYEREEPVPSRVDDRYDDAEPLRARADERYDDAPLRARSAERYDYDDAPASPAPIPPRRPAAPVEAAAPQRITTLQPRTYNEARTLGEQFRGGNPVIMNLTELDDADAKRLVDFAAGLTFGLRGSFERITSKVFLLSPQKVKVTAEDKARIADGRYPARA